MDDFLRDLRARGAGDLNGVMSTLNDGSLCRQAQDYWVRQGWVVVSPSTPLHALAGPRFSRELSLGRFCGMLEESEVSDVSEIPAEAEGSESDDDS